MKRTLSLLLAMLILLSSCSQTPANEEKETDAANAEAETAPSATEAVESETEPEETEYKPDLPEVTYDGEDFNVLVRMDSWAYDAIDVFVEEQTGEVWNDAIFDRNLKLQETYGVNLVNHPNSEPAAVFKNDFAGGLHSFDVITEQMKEMMPLSFQNYCLDWNELTYVNAEDPWFDANIKRDLSVAGKLYPMSGAVTVQPSFLSRIIFFSKGLMQDFNLTAPYDLVREGTWTIDRMMEMVETAKKDLNGDGLYGADDVMGLLTESFAHYLAGCGVHYTEPDENGIPRESFMNEHTLTAMEKVKALMTVPNSTIQYVDAAAGKDTSGYQHLYSYIRSEYFATDHFLFTQIDCGASGELRDMERGYGVLPNPKFDENQEDYYHLVDEWSCAWFIPSDSVTLEKTDILFTAWNYFSLPVVEAYYEKTLKYKRADSPDDTEMLDLVRQNTRYEIATIIDLGIARVVEAVYTTGNSASVFRAGEKQITKKIENTFKHLLPEAAE